MAVLAPIPSASVITATGVNTRFFAITRSANRRAFHSVFICFPYANLRGHTHNGITERVKTVSISTELVGSDAGFLGCFHDSAGEQAGGALAEIGVALVVRDHADG